MPASQAFALKMPLKLSRYCRKTRIHNTQATRAGAMVRRRHRQVKRQDVVELRSQQCQRKWHESAEEQQQPTKHLPREEERGKVRCD